MPYAIMELLILPFESSTASPASNYTFFAKCINMNWIILLLKYTATHFTLEFSLFACHPMSFDGTPFDFFVTILTFNRDKRALEFMNNQFSLYQLLCATFIKTSTFYQGVLTVSFMVEDFSIFEF